VSIIAAVTGALITGCIGWLVARRQRAWDARKQDYDSACAALLQIDSLLNSVIELPHSDDQLQVLGLNQLVNDIHRVIMRSPQRADGLHGLHRQLEMVKVFGLYRFTDWERQQRRVALTAKPYIAVSRDEIERVLGPHART